MVRCGGEQSMMALPAGQGGGGGGGGGGEGRWGGGCVRATGGPQGRCGEGPACLGGFLVELFWVRLVFEIDDERKGWGGGLWGGGFCGFDFAGGGGGHGIGNAMTNDKQAMTNG